jgi:hypothetical protein
MWNERKSWWAKKAEDNKADKTHYKNWCVIKVAVRYRHDTSLWNPVIVYQYKAVAKINVPHRYGATGKLVAEVEVDNLTKQEAHEVAKGLNFLDGETT